MKRNAEIDRILEARFAHDTLLALATERDHVPTVRTVDAYYEDGAFYIVTYALSGKMAQIAANPTVGVSGEWFSAHGVGENLGHVCAASNRVIAGTLREAFSAWYGNGHVDESDENTCILRVRLTDGILFADGRRYEIEFSDS